MPRPKRLDHPTYAPPWAVGSAQADRLRGAEPSPEQEILTWVNETCWKNWEQVYRPYRRQVEQNVRMVTGRQYDHYLESLGTFVDLSRFFVSPDDRWRQFPVFNWLAHYYKLTLSKLTENVPTMGFVPATADWKDATMAQVMEPAWRYQWHQMEVPESVYDLYAWVILGARAITMIRWDPDRGAATQARADAMVEFTRDGLLVRQQLTDAPFVRNTSGLWEPALVRDDAGEPVLDAAGQVQYGEPYSSRLGDLALDVLCPTSVITPYGGEPFHRKPWYTREYLLPVDEVERRFGKRVEPDDITSDDDITLKLMYGANYGMPSSPGSLMSLGTIQGITVQGMKRIREHWRREIPNDPYLSRGRVTVTTSDDVLYDDINPYWIDGQHEEAVMPFDAFDAVPLPARNEGMGDFEILNPLQTALNRRLHGVQDAVDYFEQPTEFYNENIISDEMAKQIGRPGARLPANMLPGLGDPMWRMPAGDLPRGSMDLATLLQNWMQLLGSQPFGSEGMPVTTDASGELQREVRFDTDRVWGATVRRHSYVWARIADKMGHIMAACLDDARMLTLSGEDQAAEFILVAPEMFQGRVHVTPNPESQVLESRQEKQNRIMALVAVGLPIDQALKALNYPDLNRVLRPGGPAYSMAQREHLELALGQLPPVLPEHDHATHLLVHKTYMQTVAFRDASPELQQLFRIHLFMHEQMNVAELVRQQGLMMTALAPTLGGGGGGSPAGAEEAANPTPAKAPRGEDQARGAVTPGAADPRRASIRLAT